MKTLHIAGFEDWFVGSKSGLTIENPARLLIEAITADIAQQLCAYTGAEQVTTHLLPVPQGNDSATLIEEFRLADEEMLDTINPDEDAIISFGQGDWTYGNPVIESTFVNTFESPDTEAIPIDPTRSPQETIGLGVKKVRRLIKRIRDIEFGLSKDAGTYFCNLQGRSTHLLMPEDRSLFVHLLILNSREDAVRAWRLAQADLQNKLGFASSEKLHFATVEQNLEALQAIAKAWRPLM